MYASLLALALLSAPPTAPIEEDLYGGGDYPAGAAVGALGAVLGGAGGALLGAALLSDGDDDGWGALAGVLLGGLLGITPGAVGGVLTYAAITDTEGSTGWAWGGGLLGAGAGVALLSSMGGGDSAALPILLLFPAIGASIGYGLGYSPPEVSLGFGEIDGESLLMLQGRF